MTDDLRERHREVRCCARCGKPDDAHGRYAVMHPFRYGSSVCHGCEASTPWPCDAIQQADRADKAEAEAAEWRQKFVDSETLPYIAMYDAAQRNADKAEAIARELAEGLREMLDALDGKGERRFRVDPARTALARFDAEYGESITVALGPGQFDRDEGGQV